MSDAIMSAPVAIAPRSPRSARAADRRARWTRRSLIALAALVYEAIWVASAFDKVNPTDFEIFFLPAAGLILRGHVFDFYQLRAGLLYPNANGPLGMIPVTLAAWLARSQGWLGDPVMRRALLFAIVAPFPLLVGWEAARAVERFGGRLRGMARILPYVPLLIAPELWLSALYYGHIEQVIAIWLTLAAIRILSAGRSLAAGALLGLALLARSDVALLVAPIALTLLYRRQIKDFLWLVAGAVSATLAGLAPFLIVDWRDTVFSLITYRPALPVGGGNIWSLSDASAFQALGQNYDSTLAVGAALLTTLVALILTRRLTISSPDFYLLLALTSLCGPLLIKTLWPYYYLEAALLATVWALARLVEPLRGWRTTPQSSVVGALSLMSLPRLAIMGCALLAEYGLEATSYGGWLAPWGVLLGLANLALFAIVLFVFCATPLTLAVLADKLPSPRAILLEVSINAASDSGDQPLAAPETN